MKTAVLTLAFGLSLSLFAADPKIYAGGGLSFMAAPDCAGCEDGFGLSFKGGVTNMIADMPAFGVSGELHRSLTGLNDRDVTTIAAYATYDITIPDTAFAVVPKFGIIVPNASDEIHSRDIAFSSGIGGVFHLDEQLAFYFDYTVLGEYITDYTGGVIVKF